MKKHHNEEHIAITEILDCVICNCCGKQIETPMGYNDTEITDIKLSFGYGSRHDLEMWSFEVCDDCLEKWVSSFKHPVVKLGENDITDKENL